MSKIENLQEYKLLKKYLNFDCPHKLFDLYKTYIEYMDKRVEKITEENNQKFIRNFLEFVMIAKKMYIKNNILTNNQPS